MSYTLPFFPLGTQIYTAGGGPPAAPRLTLNTQLVAGHRRSLPPLLAALATVVHGHMWLLLPPFTDIRGANSAGGADIVQCPSNSGRLYSVVYVDDIAKGFTNEHRMALLDQIPPYALDGPPAAPVVSAVAPTHGPTAGGTPVVITGTGFATATSVDFGATSAPGFVIGGPTSISVNSPAHIFATVDVTVTNPLGTSPTSGADQFTYQDVPTVTSLTPAFGPAAGGTSVVIAGTNFSAVSAVTFGATPAASYVVNSTIQITAVSPAHAGGVVDVTVTTLAGTSALSGADQFTFVAAPTVTKVTPNGNGAVAGGNAVTITGTGFAAPVTVKFGANSATSVVLVSGTSVTCVSPAGSLGTVDVRVTCPGGTSAVVFEDQFSYQAAGSPVINSMAPQTGTHLGGTSVVITGLNFSTVTAVRFDLVNATGFVVNSATQITAMTAAGAAGSGYCDVVNPVNTSARGPGGAWTYT